MGSVIDYIECPNCGQEATSDFYYKTSEETILCQSCGYYKSITIKKDCNKRINELDDEDWDIIEIKKPYACYKIKWKDYVAYQIGTVATRDDFSEMKDSLEKNEDVELFSISRYKNGEIINKTIINNEKIY